MEIEQTERVAILLPRKKTAFPRKIQLAGLIRGHSVHSLCATYALLWISYSIQKSRSYIPAAYKTRWPLCRYHRIPDSGVQELLVAALI